MFRIRPACRLAIVLAMIVGSNVWLACQLGLVPLPQADRVRSRVDLGRNLTLNVALLAERNRIAEIERLANSVVAQNPDLESIRLRRNGRELLNVGPPFAIHQLKSGTADHFSFEINDQLRKWGDLDLAFKPIRVLNTGGIPEPFALVFFMSSLTGLLSWIALAQTFRYLDPTKVVPGRVRSALDSLAEGLVLLNKQGTIVHANEAFGTIINKACDDVVGARLEDFGWCQPAIKVGAEFPWKISYHTREMRRDDLLELQTVNGSKKFNVNTNPVLDPKGDIRGVLVTFDDVTVLEQKKQDLANTVSILRTSRDEIKKQNVQLQFLASRDPLTKCYNRRVFWEFFEKHWASEPRHLLNVIMVDIDHFKSINDNYGHGTGDDVLRETGELLTHLIDRNGHVCRFGGEEFTILLPGIDIEKAHQVAKAVHTAFQRCRLGNLKVTASIGLSNRSFGAMDAQHLLDQADQCLYAAKKNGRNQVVRFDTAQQAIGHLDPKQGVAARTFGVSHSKAMALFAALAFRDREVARHAQRVADLCVAVGRNYLSPRYLFDLEIAALLHEIGSLALPDTVTDDYKLLRLWLCGNTANERSVGAGENSKCGATPQHPLAIVGSAILETAFGSIEFAKFIFDHPPVGTEIPSESDLEIHKAQRILRYCDYVVTRLPEDLILNSTVDQPRLAQFFVEMQQQLSDPAGEQLVANLRILLQAQGAQIWSRVVTEQPIDSKTNRIISEFVDPICEAIAKKSISELREIAGKLKDQTKECEQPQVSEAVQNLHRALEQRGTEFDELLSLANRVLDLSRQTRIALVDSNLPDTWQHDTVNAVRTYDADCETLARQFPLDSLESGSNPGPGGHE